VTGTPLTSSHDEVGPPGVVGPGVEHLGDVRVVHQGQRLPLGLEPCDDLGRVHARLDQLQGDLAADRPLLLGDEHDPEPAFSDLLPQPVRPDRRRGRPRVTCRRERRGEAGGRALEEPAARPVGGQQPLDLLQQPGVARAVPGEVRRPLARLVDVEGGEEDETLGHAAPP
jgi:hypothetical protein